MIEEAIKVLGGQAALAAALGVSPQAVHQWVHGRRPVPAARCLAIEHATQGRVRAADLRPDVFGAKAVAGPTPGDRRQGPHERRAPDGYDRRHIHDRRHDGDDAPPPGEAA